METLQETLSDVKATLTKTLSDKERYFQEKLDLHQKLQSAILEREVAVAEKQAYEDQVKIRLILFLSNLLSALFYT